MTTDPIYNADRTHGTLVNCLGQTVTWVPEWSEPYNTHDCDCVHCEVVEMSDPHDLSTPSFHIGPVKRAGAKYHCAACDLRWESFSMMIDEELARVYSHGFGLFK